MLRGLRTLFPESQKTPTFVPHWYIPSNFHGSRIQRIKQTRKIRSRGLLSLVHDRQVVTCHPKSRLPSPPGNYLVSLPGNTAHDTSTIINTHCIQSFFFNLKFRNLSRIDRFLKKKDTTNSVNANENTD